MTLMGEPVELRRCRHGWLLCTRDTFSIASVVTCFVEVDVVSPPDAESRPGHQ